MGQGLKPRILEFQRGGHLRLEGIKENVWHLKWELRHGGGVRAFEEPGGRELPGPDPGKSCGLETEDQAAVQTSICLLGN